MLGLNHYESPLPSPETQYQNDLHQAQTNMRSGVMAGLWFAILASLGEILSFFLIQSEGVELEGGTLGLIFYVVFVILEISSILTLTAGLKFFHSRFCAVSLLVLFCIIQLFSIVARPTGLVIRIFITIAFLRAFSNGIKGSFEYHRLQKANPALPDWVKTPG